MSVAADTHTILWYFDEPARLSPAAIMAIEDAITEDNSVFIASMTLVEVIFLEERGKITSVARQKLERELSLPSPRVVVMPLDVAIVRTMEQIPRVIVPEMPDRIIAATALYLGLPLVTRDGEIQALPPLQTIW